MNYSIKEIYYTLQGEGAQTGRPAIFCRFSGCNLWSGHETDRAQSACNFCDTDFVGTDGPLGGHYDTPESLADAVARCWRERAPLHEDNEPMVVCTGGEPLLQLDAALIGAFHARGIKVAVESNGTIKAPPGIDWLTISPKAGTHLRQRSGDELKIVYPQPGLNPEEFAVLDFRHFFLQPKDTAALEPQEGTKRMEELLGQPSFADTLSYCRSHPQWRISLQTHKFLGIP